MRFHPRIQRLGFTLIEILVVIALIGVLAGILLVAVGGATDTARAARTKSTMESISRAIDQFEIDHGTLPGIVPTHVLHEGGSSGANMTSSQNVLLHLLGGARVSVTDGAGNPLNQVAEAEYQRFVSSAQDEDNFVAVEFVEACEMNHDLQYKIAVRPVRIGEGPWINGRQYPPYISPKDHEMADFWTGDMLNDGPDGEAPFHPITSGYTKFPDFLDAWGQPILIIRRERQSGPILLAPDFSHGDYAPGDELPQYWINGIDRYVGATSLGEMRGQQKCSIGLPYLGSRIGEGTTAAERDYWLYLLLSHPALTRPEQLEDLDETDANKYGTGRAGYVLLSAGSDGVFLARKDGPRDSATGVPIDSNDFPADANDAAYQKDHQRLDDFDDVIMYGGR